MAVVYYTTLRNVNENTMGKPRFHTWKIWVGRKLRKNIMTSCGDELLSQQLNLGFDVAFNVSAAVSSNRNNFLQFMTRKPVKDITGLNV